MTTNLKPKRGAIAQRNGRPAWQAPIVRARPSVTNAQWRESRRQQQGEDIFEALFGKLLAKVRR
jgi:hypothetical protein